ERLGAYHVVHGYGLWVVVGYSRAALLDPWTKATVMRGAFAALLLAVLGVFTLLMLRHLARERETTLSLAASERRMSEMLANVNLIAITLDTEGRLTYCNDYLLRLTGWQREEVIGHSWFERFLPRNDAQAHARFSDLLRSDPVALHGERAIVTRTGEP